MRRHGQPAAAIAEVAGGRAAYELPPDLPPGRVVALPGRGEVFVRDSGGRGPAVLLLHGWLVSADINWHPTYRAMVDAGYRVVALDHRGHGRGLRGPEPFRLTDCAADAAALVDELDCAPAIAVGYSMGGPIALLAARGFPAQIGGLVACATAAHWSDPRTAAFFALGLGPLRVALGLFPKTLWSSILSRADQDATRYPVWMACELTRGNARDLIEAGRELRRYDARPWLSELRLPAAVVVTGKDLGVAAVRQRELAAGLHAPVLRAPGGHFAVSRRAEAFNAALLDALTAVHGRMRASEGQFAEAAA